MSNLEQLSKLGQAVWFDYIRRSFITSGELQNLVDQGVRGVTSNPAIFEKAIAGSADYDQDLNILVETGKSVEDIYETLVTAVPNIKFGLAFCEASGKRLLRTSGTDQDLIDLARKNALAIGAGHCFILFLGEGYFPINVLNAIKMVPEVCHIFCATANPTQVVIVETDQGRGIMGVVDGFSPQGVEAEEDVVWRKNFLRTIGYKV